MYNLNFHFPAKVLAKYQKNGDTMMNLFNFLQQWRQNTIFYNKRSIKFRKKAFNCVYRMY
jgi:hypothetical protein